MPNYGCYASRTAVKNELQIAATDTADDALLLEHLEAASRWIDAHCGRHFYPLTATRYYTAERYDQLLIDDLLVVTTLKTDDDGDRTYEITWAVTDYDLMLFNAFPKWRIAVSPDGRYSFPSGAKGVEIAGVWGFGDGESATSYEDSTTDTSEALDTTETGVDVVSGAALAVGNLILIDSEAMYVTAISSNTATVIRGVNGTTAAAHDTGKSIYVYVYPDYVVQACAELAKAWYRASKAGGSEAMGGAPGTMQTGGRIPFAVYDKLQFHRRIHVT